MNMAGKTPTTSFIIKNSPIEFAVVGPKGDYHNGVLVRSENLQTDLIGFAATGSDGSNSYSNSSPINLIFRTFYTSKKMYSVASAPHKQVFTQFDNRKSEYRFYWVGACTNLDQASVRDIFNRQIVDLLSGIELGDVEKVEWSISPVIFQCSTIHKRARARTQTFSSFMIMYAIIFFFVFAYSFRIR
jgi:hypothetical protein